MNILVYDEYCGDMGCLYRYNYADYHVIEIKEKYIDKGIVDLEDLIIKIYKEWIKISRFEAEDVIIKNREILNFNGRSKVRWVILPDGDNNRYSQEIAIREREFEEKK